MSDLNDLIARSSVIAFNSGLQAGINQERKRILGLIDHFEEGDGNPYNEKLIVSTEILKEVIENEETR